MRPLQFVQRRIDAQVVFRQAADSYSEPHRQTNVANPLKGFTMRRQLTLAAAVLALSTAAFAGDYEAFDVQGVASTKSRDQVFSELQSARKNGELKVFSSTYNPAPYFKSTKSRDEVKAELAQAQASGEYELLNAEVASFVPAQRTAVYPRTLHAAK
jgi:hypothetical protein